MVTSIVVLLPVDHHRLKVFRLSYFGISCEISFSYIKVCYQLLHNSYKCSYMFQLNYRAIIRESSSVAISSMQYVTEW
jgi:hypothetical protein